MYLVAFGGALFVEQNIFGLINLCREKVVAAAVGVQLLDKASMRCNNLFLGRTLL